MEEVFGAAYAKSLASDLVLGELGGRSAAQALDDGEPARRVWLALCSAMDVPEDRRWPLRDERRRAAQPRNRGY